MFAAAGISTISRFSVNSSGHSGRPSVLFPAASTRQFPGASSSLREFAGFVKKENESSGGDVVEELEVELDDSPGTTKGTQFSVLQRVFFPSLVRCGF